MLNKSANDKILKDSKVFTVIKKQPKNQREIRQKDCITILNKKAIVHEYELGSRIDQEINIVKDREFTFDKIFSENDDNTEVYKYTISPLINTILNKGTVTCFTYGQIWSGKISTMQSIQSCAIEDLLRESEKYDLYLNYFHLYKDKIFVDILKNRNNLQISQDQNKNMQVNSFETKKITTKEQFMDLINSANEISKDQKLNDINFNSHRICNIIIRKKDSDEECGKLTFVILGSPNNNNLEIDKSLLNLKICLKILKRKRNYLNAPFRESKLTQVLKDNFVKDDSKVIFIGCVNWGHVAHDDTLNTMRFCEI